jgi:hypothetical protein
LEQAIPFYAQYQEARTLAAQIFDVIDRESQIDPLAQDGLLAF